MDAALRDGVRAVRSLGKIGQTRSRNGKGDQVSHYVLQVNYREDEEPVRIRLGDVSPGDAETAHQEFERRLQEALSMNAPVLLSDDTDALTEPGVAIDPSRVTGVDLIEG